MRPTTGRRRALAAGGVFALALGLRLLGADALVTPQGDIRTPSADAHYYLRQVARTAQTLPALPAEEPDESCPDGAVSPWPHGLTAPTALAAVLIHGGRPTAGQSDRVAAWVPPLLGALASAALTWLAVGWLGLGAGACSGLLFAALPINVVNSSFAVFDHHVMAGLVPPLMVAGLLHGGGRLRSAGRGAEPAAPDAKAGVAGLTLAWLALALGYATWTEMWIHHAVVIAAGLTWATLGPAPARQTRRVAVLAVGACVAALPGVLSAPYSRAGWVAPDAPSRFTLWAALATAAAAVAAAAAATRLLGAAARRPAEPSPQPTPNQASPTHSSPVEASPVEASPVEASPTQGRATRYGALSAVGLAAVLAALVAVAVGYAVDPGLRRAVSDAVAFAARSGVIGAIDESLPLWQRPFPQSVLLLSGAAVLVPVLPLAFRGCEPATGRMLTAWYALSLPLAVLQGRFALAFAAPFALAWGTWVVHGPWRPQPRGEHHTPRPGLNHAARGLALVLAGSVAISAWGTRPWQARHESRDRLMRWVRAEVGPAPASASRRCAMGPWDIGHELLRVGGQPVVAHNFTEGAHRAPIRDTAELWLSATPAAAEALLARRQVRLLWVGPQDRTRLGRMADALGRRLPDSLLHTTWGRLWHANGAALRLGDQTLAGYGHLRRVRTSPLRVTLPGGDGRPSAHDKVFVWVPGAVLTATAPPGARVEARLRVQHEGDRPFVFAQVAHADHRGHVALRLPYATTAMPLGVRALGPARVRVAGGPWRAVVIPEDAVQQGRRVPVGRLAERGDRRDSGAGG